MYSKIAKALIMGAVLTVSLWHCKPNAAEQPAAEVAEVDTQGDQLERGAYLLNTMGCDDCHTPKIMTEQGPAPDMSRRLMGHPADEAFPPEFDKTLITQKGLAVFNGGLTAAAGPWGITFAANLTPDDTGIGTWTEAQFIKALREGKTKGLDNSRPILPPMPWQNFAKMTDEDLGALFAYIKTLPAISNVVPAPKPL